MLLDLRNVAGAHFDEKGAKRDLEAIARKDPGRRPTLLLRPRKRRVAIGRESSNSCPATSSNVGPQSPYAAIVTLGRVICCYPSFEPLLNGALRHTNHVFAYSYPRELWYVHAAIGVENTVRYRKGNPFKAFVIPSIE